jgi:RNA polymerase primary sigma factor
MSYEAALCLQLKAFGRQQGFLTHAQVNEHLPSTAVDPEEISSIVDQLEHHGVRVVENPPSGGE